MVWFYLFTYSKPSNLSLGVYYGESSTDFIEWGLVINESWLQYQFVYNKINEQSTSVEPLVQIRYLGIVQNAFQHDRLLPLILNGEEAATIGHGG